MTDGTIHGDRSENSQDPWEGGDLVSVLKWLQGKKTYITAVAIAVTGGLQAAGQITAEQSQIILSILGAAGLITLRSAVAKVE